MFLPPGKNTTAVDPAPVADSGADAEVSAETDAAPEKTVPSGCTISSPSDVSNGAPPNSPSAELRMNTFRTSAAEAVAPHDVLVEIGVDAVSDDSARHEPSDDTCRSFPPRIEDEIAQAPSDDAVTGTSA